MTNSRSTASDPLTVALRMLTRRDHSEAELQQKLLRFGFSASQIETVLQRCRDYGYLDDKRYALERARSLLRSGRGVGRKILLELRRRGIDEATALEALEQAGREFEPRQLLHDQLQRRFPGFDYATAAEKERRRVVGYFQRRGFSLEEIFAVLKSA